jgi:serpin B
MKRLVVAFIASLVMMSGCVYGNAGDFLYTPESIETSFVNQYGEGLAYVRFRDSEAASMLSSFAGKTSGALEGDGDVVFSPIGLWLALACTCEAASGDALTELCTALGADDAESVRSAADDVSALIFENNIGRLRLATSAWVSDDWAVADAPLAAMSEHYRTSVYCGDMDSPSAKSALKGWLADNAGGLDAKFDPEAMITLFSALVFTDQWQTQFDASATKRGVFHRADGTASPVDFINMTFSSHSYTVGDGWATSSLPLKNGCSMWFFLPDEDVGLDALLLPDTYAGLLDVARKPFDADTRSGEVVFSIPKFAYESPLDIDALVRSLGVTAIYDGTRDPLSPLGVPGAYLSSIKQSSKIAVDENGVSVSSYTQIIFYGAAMPDGRLELILNRPFLWLLCTGDGVPLFVGAVRNAGTAG